MQVYELWAPFKFSYFKRIRLSYHVSFIVKHLRYIEGMHVILVKKTITLAFEMKETQMVKDVHLLPIQESQHFVNFLGTLTISSPSHIP